MLGAVCGRAVPAQGGAEAGKGSVRFQFIAPYPKTPEHRRRCVTQGAGRAWDYFYSNIGNLWDQKAARALAEEPYCTR